jgi:uncharacterized protein YecE (DUF72 family)
VKASELITHVKRFSGTKTLVRDFGYIADLLGPRMGCFLFQLPPSFHYSRARLDRIVSQLDPTHRNVVEFRHASWWNERVYTAFRAAGIIFCSCSGPKLPDELIATADDIHIRFHGTSGGIGTTTLRRNWRYGWRESVPAVQSGFGPISIMIGTDLPSRMPVLCYGNCSLLEENFELLTFDYWKLEWPIDGLEGLL